MEATQMSASICNEGKSFWKGKVHYLFKGIVILLFSSACFEVNYISKRGTGGILPHRWLTGPPGLILIRKRQEHALGSLKCHVFIQGLR